MAATTGFYERAITGTTFDKLIEAFTMYTSSVLRFFFYIYAILISLDVTWTPVTGFPISVKVSTVN